MKEMTCIVCPKGCTIHYEIKDGKAINITGNTCKRGYEYCISEVEHPMRTITSTVKINGSHYHRLPVITDKPIPKDKIFDLMNEIYQIEVNAPIQIGQVIKKLDSVDANLIASRSL